MKKLLKIMTVLSVLVAVGCASAPETEPEPTPEPEVTPAEEVVNPAEEDRATAEELRSIVERNQFGEESPEAYAAAETAFLAAEELYQEAPNQSVALYIEASENYRQVINDGSRAKADRLRTEVQAERDQALSVRAEVAQRQQYNQAVADLERAETLLEEEAYEDAFASFESARQGFNAAYGTARKQRDEAQRALDQLDSDLVETAGDLERMQDDMEADNE